MGMEALRSQVEHERVWWSNVAILFPLMRLRIVPACRTLIALPPTAAESRPKRVPGSTSTPARAAFPFEVLRGAAV